MRHLGSLADNPKPSTWLEWKAQNGSKRWYRRPPRAIEWVFDWVNYHLEHWAFAEFLGHVGRFTVLVVAISWVLEADSRTKEHHNRAWELINCARLYGGGRGEETPFRTSTQIALVSSPLL